MKMISNLQTWCRLCAKRDETKIDIFSSNVEHQPNIPDLVEKFFKISIISTDVFPTVACEQCLDFVIKLSHFADHCEKVDRMFNDIYKNLKKKDLNLDEYRLHYGIADDPLEEDVESKMIVEVPFLKSDASEEEDSDIESQSEKRQNEQCSSSHSPVELNGNLEELDEVENRNFKFTSRKQRRKLNRIQRENMTETKIRRTKMKMVLVKEEASSSSEFISDEGDKIFNRIEIDGGSRCDSEQFEKSEKISLDEELGNYNEESEEETKEENESKRLSGRKVWSGKLKLDRRKEQDSESILSYKTSKWACTIANCGQAFPTRRILRRHRRSHSPSDLFKRVCRLCGMKFPKLTDLDNHFRDDHKGEDAYVCEKCNKSFGKLRSLKDHQYVHSQEAKYECSKCSKKFKNSTGLKAHEDTHNDTTYICSDCGIQLNTKATLRNHMLIHTGTKTYKCHYCGNEYKRTKTLKNHLILHTGLRPYTCNFCGKTFANGSNCRAHKKNAHPEELAALEAKGVDTSKTVLPKMEQLTSVTTDIRKVVSKNLNRSRAKDLFSKTFSSFTCKKQNLQANKIDESVNYISSHLSEKKERFSNDNFELHQQQEQQSQHSVDHYQSQVTQSSISEESLNVGNGQPISTQQFNYSEMKVETSSLYPRSAIENYEIPLTFNARLFN